MSTGHDTSRGPTRDEVAGYFVSMLYGRPAESTGRMAPAAYGYLVSRTGTASPKGWYVRKWEKA